MCLAINWLTYYDGSGVALGYTVHNQKAREAVVAAGAVLDDNAKVVVQVTTAHQFKPVKNRLNVLYTAWESDVMPPAFQAGLQRADAVIVPSQFLVPVVKQYVAPHIGVYCCPLGVDTTRFKYVEREPAKERPFRWLWCGAQNLHKGIIPLHAVWSRFVARSDMELYLKTTCEDKDDGALQQVNDNVVVDSRYLSRNKLAEVYKYAHAFLFPSAGEGFALTLAEAMATGLPCLYTDWGAMQDLCRPDTGYPLRYELRRSAIRLQKPPSPGKPGDFECNAAQAVVGIDSMADVMEYVMANYDEASARGLRAANRIRNYYSWENTGQLLLRILAEVERKAS